MISGVDIRPATATGNRSSLLNQSSRAINFRNQESDNS